MSTPIAMQHGARGATDATDDPVAAAADVPVPPPSLPGRQGALAGLLPAVALALGALVAWELAVRLLHIPRFLLPAPSVVIARVVAERALMLDNVGMTMLAAALGFVIGTALAFASAVLFLYSRTVERAFLPWAVVLKTIPVLAIAPLLTIWLGFGIAPKVAIAAIACYFPTLVNVTRGLRSVDRSVLDFMQVIQAPPLQVFWHARLYAAAPYLFSAMKITVGMAVIGAIVAEFTGANVGIGTLIVNAGYQQDTALLFSAIAVTSLATLALFYAVTAAERLLLRWPGAREDR